MFSNFILLKYSPNHFLNTEKKYSISSVLGRSNFELVFLNLLLLYKFSLKDSYMTKDIQERSFKIIQLIFFILGISAVIISILADYFGLGRGGFGRSQLVLLLLGLIFILFGITLYFRIFQIWFLKLVYSRLFLSFLLFLIVFLMLEMVLRFSRKEKSDTPESREFQALLSMVYDERLGNRIPPYSGGHDRNGFRNDFVPDKADIVAIGDSQTYGLNATRGDSWPKALERISGLKTYNMGLGGYGPVQYNELVDDALKLSPKIIVVGLYFGNDIYDAYRMVYTNQRYASYRNPKAGDELLVDNIAHEYQKFGYGLNYTWKDWLLNNSAVFSFINHRMVHLFKRFGLIPVDESFHRAKLWAETHPEYGLVYDDGNVQRVFTPAYRLLALNLNDPRIAEGMRITKDMMLRMQDKVRRKGVFLIILLIPTKELVYVDDVPPERMNKSFKLLVEMEEKAREQIIQFCDENDIYWIDALPGLKINRRKSIYLTNVDGHPTSEGYFVIAKIVYDKLVELGIIEK